MSKEQSRRRLLLMLFVLVLAAGVWLLRPVLTPFLLAALLAYLLQPAVSGLQKLEVHPACAILVVYVYLFIALALLLSLCLPLVTVQLQNLAELLPQLASQLLEGLSARAGQKGAFAAWLSALPHSTLAALEQASSERLAGLLDASARQVGDLIKAAVCLVLAPFLAFYLLRDREQLAQTVVNWLPIDERGSILDLIGRLDRLLRQFVRGYVLVAALVALAATLFYQLLGLDNALALGLIMGVADLIPYLGPLLGALPALAIAFEQGRGLFVLTGAGLLALQQLEAAVVTPKVMDSQMGLHPLATVLAVLAGGWLGGALGAILAVPLLAAALVVVKYVWERLVGVKIF